MLEKYFKLGESNTNIKTEILAGITTFVTMSYIIFVNPDILSAPASIMGDEILSLQIKNGVFFATCFSAFIGTMMMGLYAKLPFAQAPGMGINVFFAYTVMLTMGYTYNQSLAIVLFSGITFLILTATGMREAIVHAIPSNIKLAISGGIGLFLAFVGLKNGGLIVANDATFVTLVNFSNIFKDFSLVNGALMTVIGLLLISVLYARKIKSAIILGIILTTVIGIPLGKTKFGGTFGIQNFGTQWHDFLNTSFFKLDIISLFEGKSFIMALLTVIMLVITFTLVDMFDTLGTLLGTAKKANLLDENGDMVNMKQALMCDSVATTAGSLLGTSTVGTYVESASGISEGGRTGLTSVVTGILFLFALLLAPIISIVPTEATAPALIFVGVLMMSSLKEIDFNNMAEAIPAFLTIVMMPFTYSIANGISIGIIFYVLIQIFMGKIKNLKPITVVLAILFIIRYMFIAM